LVIWRVTGYHPAPGLALNVTDFFISA